MKDGIVKNILIKMGIIPRYSEVSLFLMSLTFLLLFFTNSIIGKEIYSFLIGHNNDPTDLIASIFFVIIIFLGAILSIYNGFVKRKKEDIEKYCMLFFAVIINSVIGIIAASYIIMHSEGYLIIFPILNIVESFLTLLIFRYTSAIDIDAISDEDARTNEIKIGIIATIIIFILSQYVFKNFWAITFSICLAYVAFVNDILSSLFFPKKSVA